MIPTSKLRFCHRYRTPWRQRQGPILPTRGRQLDWIIRILHSRYRFQIWIIKQVIKNLGLVALEITEGRAPRTSCLAGRVLDKASHSVKSREAPPPITSEPLEWAWIIIISSPWREHSSIIRTTITTTKNTAANGTGHQYQMRPKAQARQVAATMSHPAAAPTSRRKIDSQGSSLAKQALPTPKMALNQPARTTLVTILHLRVLLWATWTTPEAAQLSSHPCSKATAGRRAT